MSIFDDYASSDSIGRPVRRRTNRRPWIWMTITGVAVLLVVLSIFSFRNGDADDTSAVNDEIVQEDAVSDSADIPAVEQPDGQFEEDSDLTRGADLFSAPEDPARLIEMIRASTVTIYCGDIQGSGWAIDLGAVVADLSEEEQALEDEYPFEIVTNHHVVEDCIADPFSLEAQVEDVVLDAYLYSWDVDNDLALVAIKQDVPALGTSRTPQAGWWAMAVGTPYGLEGSIAIGNVMNIDGTDVVSTAPLNAGMSGGPLVNSNGEVMGTNTWFYLDDEIQDWNVAVGLPALCDEIVDCEEGDYWNQ